MCVRARVYLTFTHIKTHTQTHLTDEVAKTRHKASFHFNETCNLAQSKVDLLMFLSQKLDKFTQQGDIVDLQHAVLRFDQDTLRMTMGRHATAHASTQEQL